MLLPPHRLEGILLRRYKRFLAEVLLADGTMLTAHCPNSGSMRGCSTPGSRVLLSLSSNPTRKYPWTLEMAQTCSHWVGVHTGRTNALVAEGLRQGWLNEYGRITAIRPEVVVSAKSRIDFLLETEAQGRVYVEVKHCSLAERDVALFPDAVTERGARHLRELAALAAAGDGAAIIFCVQRADVKVCSLASHIDPTYAKEARLAQAQGVRFFAWQAALHPDRIILDRKIPFLLPPQEDDDG